MDNSPCSARGCAGEHFAEGENMDDIQKVSGVLSNTRGTAESRTQEDLAPR